MSKQKASIVHHERDMVIFTDINANKKYWNTSGEGFQIGRTLV